MIIQYFLSKENSLIPKKVIQRKTDNGPNNGQETNSQKPLKFAQQSCLLHLCVKAESTAMIFYFPNNLRRNAKNPPSFSCSRFCCSAKSCKALARVASSTPAPVIARTTPDKSADLLDEGEETLL